MSRYMLLAVGLAAALGGCARPPAVRGVATAMSPIVTGLHASGDTTVARFNLQRSAIDRNQRVLKIQRDDAARATRMRTRDWGDAGDKARVERLERLRLEDASLLADPYAGLTDPVLAVTEAEPLKLTGLDAALKSLARLKRDNSTLSVDEVIAFAKAVKAEQAKLQTDEAGAAAAAPASPTP